MLIVKCHQFLKTIGCRPPCRYTTFDLSVGSTIEDDEDEGKVEDGAMVAIGIRAPNPYRLLADYKDEGDAHDHHQCKLAGPSRRSI